MRGYCLLRTGSTSGEGGWGDTCVRVAYTDTYTLQTPNRWTVDLYMAPDHPLFLNSPRNMVNDGSYPPGRSEAD